MIKAYRKKAKAIPIIGTILNSLKSENPTENAPSIQAVINEFTNYIKLDGSTVSTEKDWNDLEPNKVYLTSGTYSTSNNAPVNGNLSGVLIYMGMTNGAVQIYLPRIESQKIYVRGKYSSAWRKWICSADGGNALSISGIEINDLVQISKSGLLRYAIINNNGLNVMISNGSNNGRIEYINNYNEAGDATNLPISQMVAVKIPYVLTSSMAMVILYELWPVPGRVWQNEYNQSWKGWKLKSGEYTLWTGSAQETQGVALSESYKKFGHVEIRTSTGLVFEVPTYTQSTYDGRVYKGGDDQDFNLYGLQVEFTAEKNMYISKAKLRSLMNNTTSKFTISRVTGKP